MRPPPLEKLLFSQKFNRTISHWIVIPINFIILTDHLAFLWCEVLPVHPLIILLHGEPLLMGIHAMQNLLHMVL